MLHATLVPHLHVDEVPDERFVLRDPAQIAHLLRRLLDIAAPITASYGNGGEVLHTKLTSITRDERSIYLAWDGDDEKNATVAASGRLACMTELDGIRVQFALTVDGSFARAHAFAARMPESLLRIQRRDYFRLITPTAAGIVCTLPGPRPNDPRHRVAAPVVDISGSGLAILVPQGTPLAADAIIEHCQLRLADARSFDCVLSVRNLFKIIDAHGRVQIRLGCSFVRLPDTNVVAIQRYIRQAEVERKARAEAEREEAAETARQHADRERRLRASGR